ncbi:hypothetical protein AB0E10_01425 [Streptomyces sp. NPDC048045]|uniref:hypothetical protein n=1 Tax=Streptomyces sp. NPDC048045 TaxID=3154710 RepID=UPI003431624C
MSDFASRMWETVRQERFLLQDPEQLWAMVESADGPTASGLGELLKEAAKTIKEIGGDLQTHSMAVEWEGEGGAAFRTWCYQAALTTVSLGDYSENAGKWLGHAADTLHEVKPQLEILRKQSAGPRSVLEAHTAKATNVGDHGGGPSDSAVTKAKTQYANTRAEAGGLMMKLAQSYAASTEQINAVEAPKFPELPERFVPPKVDDGTHVSAPTTQESPGPGTVRRVKSNTYERAASSRSGGTGSVPQPSTTHHLKDPVDVPRHVPPNAHIDVPHTAIDSTGTLPPAPTVASAHSAPPAGPSSPDVRTPSATGALPPVFGAGTTRPPGVREGGERPVYRGRGSLPTPSGPGTSGSPRIPGRGLFGPSVTGSEPAPERGPLSPAPAQGANGITGGRPVTPSAGRPAGAIPRGNVIGGAPNQQQPPKGRGAVPGSPTARTTSSRGDNSAVNREGAPRGRMPATSNGIVGGQPRPSRDRGRAGTTSRNVRPASEAAAEEPLPRRGGRPRGASASAPNRDDRSARDKRSDSRAADPAEDRDLQAEERNNRPVPPHLPKGPDGDIGREA